MTYISNMKKIAIVFALFTTSLMLSACSDSISTIDVEEIEALNKNIVSELETYTKEVTELAVQLNRMYELSDKEKKAVIDKVDKEEYSLSESGIFYRKDLTDGSAVFVSGYVEIDERVKSIVYLTQDIDLTFKTIAERHSEIAQVYYNDENSYNRIYPSFDVLTQYQAKMNIPEFNFYYLADYEHNPEKKAVWVQEPYVDPAGRGWMISTIAPVYEGEELRGVAGIDLTINVITEKYLQSEDLFMITSDGTVVTISEKLSTTLSLPILKNHRYIETIKSDSYMVDDFNLLKSKNEEIRNFADDIVNSSENVLEVTIEDEVYRVTKSKIESLDWIILKMVKK